MKKSLAALTIDKIQAEYDAIYAMATGGAETAQNVLNACMRFRGMVELAQSVELLTAPQANACYYEIFLLEDKARLTSAVSL